MKKTAVFAFLAFFLTLPPSHAFEAVRQFKASGEVRTVNPVSSQVTIEHGTIKGLAGEGVTEFYVSDVAILKDIAKSDLVDFEITDTKGDVRITHITKTGVAPPREEGIPVGEALQQTFQGVGQAAKGGASETAVAGTDPRIQDGEVKQKLATF